MKIKDKLDFLQMEVIFNAPTPDFGVGMTNLGTAERPLFYKDNGSKVLAVAHLDSVNDSTHFHHVEICGKDVILSARCDDRAGAYIILDLLPKLGICVDVLLTTDEEISKSTASDFLPEKKYNWMFQFDRRLNDVVTYMYDEKKWEESIKLAGFKLGRGSASDISKMEKLEICGMNVGCGYDDEHDPLAHLFVDMMCSQVGLFSKFFYAFKDTAFPYEQDVYVPASKPVKYFPSYKPIRPTISAYAQDMLDYGEYLDIDYFPAQCKFCESDLTLDASVSDIFLGICKECEGYAIVCEGCDEWTDIRQMAVTIDDLEVVLCEECKGEIYGNDNDRFIGRTFGEAGAG